MPRRAFTRFLVSLILWTACLFSAPGMAAGFEGPLYIRNSLPVFLTLGSPSMLSAAGEDSVDVDLTYSSTYIVADSSEWSFGFDLEAAIMDIRLRKLILDDSMEVGIDIPVLSFNSGFLDGFLETYHDAFGFPDYGRSRRPPNDFLFEVTRGSDTVVTGESGGIALGDIRIGLKKTVYGGDPLVSVYGYVELPTGDPGDGYGNGALDASVALLVNKAVGGSVMTYFNAGAVFTGGLRAEENVDLEDYLYGGAALEWRCSGRVSLNAQFFIQGSPFGSTGIRAIDEVSTILSFGGRYRTGSGALELSFSEDTNTAGAPDFMIGLGYRYRLR
ncbi:MAG: DUF3187 family protein [Nitrospirae bacterium]|nr:DUF3187 family protein [Nitrospirota bacterium]